MLEWHGRNVALPTTAAPRPHICIQTAYGGLDTNPFPSALLMKPSLAAHV